MNVFKTFGVAAALGSLCLSCATIDPSRDETGFVRIFDGKTLNGWELHGKKGDGYGVKHGAIYCAKGGGGNLLTTKTYDNFILRFDFLLERESNNGIAIRSPLGGKSLAYEGIEIQVLDAAYSKPLKPAQYHGSIYDVVPALRGALRSAGQWNSEEIIADGRHIKVTVNGKVIVDADLNDVTDPETLKKHPGLLRESGHIGFLGHNDYCEFANLRIKELPNTRRLGSPFTRDNNPPPGFSALFNGRDLTGWQGVLARTNDNPAARAMLSPAARAAAQAKANQLMRDHWSIQRGVLTYDGKGYSLGSAKDYGDFELIVDWKITEGGDSGIYLRGAPQVQIWDRAEGSGGLYNNKIHTNKPPVRADRFVGEWNRFQILMIGDKVTVHLNDELVANAVTMENYWERNKPIYPFGPIELQHHGSSLYFKNIFVRELPRKENKTTNPFFP